MQIMVGTKREITIQQWQEQLEKHIKRANDSMECFRRYHESDDLRHLREDAEKLIEYCNHTIEVIDTMDQIGIV